MYKVYFSDTRQSSMIVVLKTSEEAIKFATNLGALYIEEDQENPGHFDAIDKHGRVICIEPTNRKREN